MLVAHSVQLLAPDAFDSQPALLATGITKCFGSLRANASIDIALYAGEILAVLGENGAGKSTLLKILYGIYAPDSGSLHVRGKLVQLAHPQAARQAGIGMVFQNFQLVPALTVWENIALFLPENQANLTKTQLLEKINAFAERYQLAIDPLQPVWQLDVGQRQRVEILKVLLSGATILLFDEPTSVLAPSEVATFLNLLHRLRQEGYAILVITHKIPEVLQCADRVTVLRAGQVVFHTQQMSTLTESELVMHMIGEQLAPLRTQPDAQRAATQAPTFAIVNAKLRDDRGRAILQDINLAIHAGEIVGVAGIAGNGQRELAEACVGLRPLEHGQILINGQALPAGKTAAFLAAGIASCSENPLEDAIVPGLTVLQHSVIGGLPEYRRHWGIDWRRVRAAFTALPTAQALQVAAPERRADQLSGGNVQRLMLSLALARNPSILIASYPTRGLDIATTRVVHQLLLAQRAAGMGILIFSEDLGELYTLSDHIIVLGQGRISPIFDPKTAPATEVAAWMVSGGTHAYVQQ